MNDALRYATACDNKHPADGCRRRYMYQTKMSCIGTMKLLCSIMRNTTRRPDQPYKEVAYIGDTAPTLLSADALWSSSNHKCSDAAAAATHSRTHKQPSGTAPTQKLLLLYCGSDAAVRLCPDKTSEYSFRVRLTF